MSFRQLAHARALAFHGNFRLSPAATQFVDELHRVKSEMDLKTAELAAKFGLQ
jgi:hypothetical protein